MRAATLDRLMIAPRFRWLIRRTASRVQKKVPSRCTASIRRHDSSERFWVTSRWVCAPCPLTISMIRASVLRLIPARSSPGPTAMPALFTRISSAPSSRSMVVNIALTWALSATSAWIARPPADPFISDTVFSATSRRTSLTTTCAPSSAKSSAIARPSPDPPPVTSATRSVSFIGRYLRSLFVLPVPAHRPHPRPKGERNQGGRDEEVLGLHPAPSLSLPPRPSPCQRAQLSDERQAALQELSTPTSSHLALATRREGAMACSSRRPHRRRSLGSRLNRIFD